MKIYNAPSATIIELEIADIITLSAPDDLADFDDIIKAPTNWFN